MLKRLLSVILFLLVGSFTMAQDYRLMLQSGGKPTAIAPEKYTYNAPSLRSAKFGNGQYAILQFHQIPTEQAKQIIKQNGILLFDYLPHYAFWAYIPENITATQLQSLGVKNIYPYEATDKLSKVFAEKGIPTWAVKQKGKVDVLVQIYPNVSVERVKNFFLQKGWIEILREKAMPEMMELRIPENRLNELAAVPFVFFVEPIFPEPQLENREATSNHRINFMNSEYTGGRKYDGTGIVVSMGDDGSADTHIDRQGRTNHNGTSQGGDHGDHVSGIIMGAGNLNPLLKGQAPGAFLQVYSGHNDIDQMPTPYNTQNVRITSHSLGEGLNAGYNTGARQVDQQIRQLPELMHVFSAGNSGSGFFTITGGRKAGKNVIAVANLSKTDVIASTSSRGPAADGRLKPEIAAVGTSVLSTGENNTYNTKSGTSMACPAISGTLAALYHAYRSLNANQMPTSDLMKAILLNTADDLGNEGPDFTFGYGRVNARRAILCLEQNRYYQNSISQSTTQTQIINVPAGTKQLKVMLYWNDYEGAASASVPLVNNLNLTVTTPTSTIVQPWVLDPNNPSAVAVRGTDNINNSEQVTIDDPAAGNYTISVNGFSVPQGPQNYVVVYEFVRDEVVLTFPIGGESFSPGTSEVIRWDAWGSSGTFDLEYTTNGGATWTSIASGISGSSRSFTWSVPNVSSGQVKVRVKKGSQSSESIANFSIFPFPTGLTLANGCGGVQLTWSPVAGATSYEVFKLGTMYMQSEGTTNTTNFLLPATIGESGWYAVRALGTNGATSRRTNAQNFTYTTSVCTTDASISSISPSGNSCNLTENQQIRIVVKNEGTTLITNINVSYEVKKSDNTILLNGTRNIVSLAPNATENIDLTADFSISEETYTISASLTATGDQNAANNQRTTTAKNIGVNVSLTQNGTKLVATAGYRNYRWFRDDVFIGTTNSVNELDINQTGTYKVEAQSISSTCKKMSEPLVVSILALEDISNELVVYPNPMQNRLQIDLPKQMQGSKVVAITDLSGRILYKHTYNQENQLEIAVDKLPKGMYLLEVKNEYYKAVRKLMK